MSDTSQDLDKKKESSVNLKVDQYVMSPFDGLGIVKKIFDHETHKTKFYEFFFKAENLTVMIPLNQIKAEKIRPLCTKKHTKRVFDVLAEPPKGGRGMWSKRAQEYEAKMNLGTTLFTAQVVRDLFSGSNDPSRSYSERVMYEKALERIVSEMAVVLGLEEDEMEAKIIKILQKSNAVEPKEIKTQHPDDDFNDDDLEKFSDDED